MGGSNAQRFAYREDMRKIPLFKTPAARRGGGADVEMLAGRRVPLCLVELFLNAYCLSPGLNSLL